MRETEQTESHPQEYYPIFEAYFYSSLHSPPPLISSKSGATAEKDRDETRTAASPLPLLPLSSLAPIKLALVPIA